MAIPEKDPERVSISQVKLGRMLQKDVITADPSCYLKHKDALTMTATDFTKDMRDSGCENIIIYCYDQGLGQKVLDHIAAVAYKTPCVKGATYYLISLHQ